MKEEPTQRPPGRTPAHRAPQAELNEKFGLGSGGVNSSLAWSGGASVLRQLIQFAGTLILARILDPSAFGSAAIVMTLVLFAQTFTDLGIAPAIVHSEKISQRLLSTAFLVNLLSGFFLTIAVSALAHPIASFFHQRSIAGLIVVGSLNFSVSFAVVQMALLERTMRFREIAVIEVVSMLGGWVVAVYAAKHDAGAVSIVLAPLSTTTMMSILFSMRLRWYPTSLMTIPDLRYLWNYSSWLVAFNLVNYWARSADNLLLGRYASSTTLGVYARAYDLMLLPIQQISTVLARVLLPALAAIRENKQEFRSAWLRSVYVSWLLGLPLGLGSCVAAPALMETAFGRPWLPAAPILSVLAASVAPQLIGRTLGAVFQAMGETSAQFRLGLLSSAITVGCIAIGLLGGAIGVATGATVGLYLGIGLTIQRVLKLVDGSWPHLLSMLPRSTAAAALMAIAALVPRLTLHSMPAYQMLAIQIAIAIVVYPALVWSLDRRRVREALAFSRVSVSRES